MGSGTTCLAARPRAPTDPVLAWKLGGVVVAAAAAAVVAAAEGDQDEDSSGQPRAVALGLHPWQAAYRHAAKKRDERTYAVAANGLVERQALLFREPSERSLPSPSTFAEVG